MRVEYDAIYSEGADRLVLYRGVGYGKPADVYKNSRDYLLSRNDLELYDDFEVEKNVLLKHTANDPVAFGDVVTYIGGITYKLVKLWDMFLIKDENMENLLLFYEECMGARRDRRGDK